MAGPLLTAQGTLLYVKEGTLDQAKPDLKSPCQSFWDFKTFMVPGFSKQPNFYVNNIFIYKI